MPRAVFEAERVRVGEVAGYEGEELWGKEKKGR